MSRFLLLGAGFSRNWGGWLASEAFEYVLGCQEIRTNPQLRALLWKHQVSGGFEDALAELQQVYAHSLAPGDQAAMKAFQEAVTRMFGDMNRAFIELVDWEFQRTDRARMLGPFLTQFDAIFTLNQDVFLEHHYQSQDISLLGSRRWAGAELPGMQRRASEDPRYATSWGMSTWVPLPDSEFRVARGSQPLFKLHGSSNWKDTWGSDLMVIGGTKALEIGQRPILTWYARLFEECLSSANARLMVIGYGFRDQHINDILARASERGLQMFVIAPEGAEIAMRLNQTRSPGQIAAPSALEEVLKRTLIGASRRPLRDTFGSDTAEFAKVTRFFET